MAFYTTLFTATDSELTELFPGWRSPLATPREVKRKNPFTGNEMTVTTWDPGESLVAISLGSIHDARDRPFLPPLVPPDGEFRDYQKWLEENCPPLLRTLPHVATKGISEFELQQLGGALIGDDAPAARFVDCCEGQGTIGALQAAAIPLLAEATDERLNDYAAQWCERLEMNGMEGRDEMLWAIQRVAALARDARQRSATVFSHTKV